MSSPSPENDQDVKSEKKNALVEHQTSASSTANNNHHHHQQEREHSRPSVKSAVNHVEPVSFWALFRFATPWDYFLMSIGGFCGLANGCALAGFSIILGDLFDVLNSPNEAAATNLALIFVWLGLGTFAAATLQVGLFTATSERMTILLRRQYLASVLRQEVGFFDLAGTGTIASRLAENSVLFREGLGEKLAQLFQFFAMFVGGLCVGFIYVWQLCLVILAISPLMGFAGYFMAKSLTELSSGQLEAYAQAGAIAEESFSMIRTITAFGLQKFKIGKYREELEVAARKSTKQGVSTGFGFGGVMFAYFISYAIAFYVGAVLVTNSRTLSANDRPPVNGTASFCKVNAVIPQNCSGNGVLVFQSIADVCNCYQCQCGCYAPPTYPNVVSGVYQFTEATSCTTGGDVLLTFFAVLIGSFAIGQAGPSFSAIAKARGAARPLYDVIDRKPEIDSESEAGLKPEITTGTIEFRNVAFSYPTRLENPVFTNLNLRIEGGQRIALVGESGCGKSSIIALLERYYQINAGQILIDGVDISEMNVKHLRRNMGLVSQEPILFATTVRENVRFGRPDATDEEVEQACRDANCEEFINAFDNKYDTYVTSSLVSGGQKQRLSIARALLRNPKILLLDEATSALDNESEQKVNHAIDNLLAKSGGKRTIIVIAHRLTSIMQCDCIYVIEKGVVIEQGSHAELCDKPNGMYASLFKLSERSNEKKHALSKMGSEAVISNSFKHIGGGSSATTATSSSSSSQSKPGPAGSLQDARTDSSSSLVANGALDKTKKKKYSIWRAFDFAREDRLYFIPGIIAAAANGLTFPLFALLFSRLLTTFYYPTNSQVLQEASVWSLAFFGLALGNAIAIFFQNLTFGFISGRMTKRTRIATFQKVLSMDIGFFDEKRNSVGALTSKLAQDAAMVKAAISDRVEVGVMNLSTIISGFVIAFIASWQLSLVVFSMFPALIVSGALQMLVMSGLANTDQKALEKASHTLSESISGIRTVCAFEMQEGVRKLYYEQLKGPLQAAKRKGITGGLGFGFGQAMMFFAYALALWYGTTLIIAGTITFTDLNQSLFGILMTAMALGQAIAMAPDIGKGAAAVQSVFELLDTESKINPFDESGEKPSQMLGDIQFEQVTFAYPTRPTVPILQNFNLDIPRGQVVAFVGSSGSGKSTLCLLLERFYDPAGLVKIDGVDVRTLNLEWLRSNLSIVSQEPALMRGTILENIRAGNMDATDEECMEAAKKANAYDFIMSFPNGFATDLQTAQGVSGGQKQRIAIARALVRPARIWLFDEATSALDEESQKKVQDTLRNLVETEKNTQIIVAHRLSTIRNADIIVVLQHGVVVEQGSFEELSGIENGAFASLLRAQETQDEQHHQ